MTKQWDLHKATIKTLYAENTLSVVRQIMIEKYNFKASTRAYRGRLIRWGVRKYNCKRRNERASSSASSSHGGFSSRSDSLSPTLLSRGSGGMEPTGSVAAAQHVGTTRRVSDGQLSMSSRVDQTYPPMDDDHHNQHHQPYAESYANTNTKVRMLLSPAQSDAQYGWSAPLAHANHSSSAAAAAHATSSTNLDGYNNHAGEPSAPLPYFDYTPLTPPLNAYSSSASSTAPYDTEHHHHQHVGGHGYYRPAQRHHGTGQMELPYVPVRDYGHGLGHGQTVSTAHGLRDDDGADGADGHYLQDRDVNQSP